MRIAFPLGLALAVGGCRAILGIDDIPLESASVDGGTSASTTGGGNCGDTQSTSANCGTCGHDCGGGQCMSGVCQPLVVMAGSGDFPIELILENGTLFAAFGGSILSCADLAKGCGNAPKTLVTTDGGTNAQIRDVTLTTAGLYYSVQEDSGTDSGVWFVARDGTGLKRVATGDPYYIAASDSYLYYADQPANSDDVLRGCALPACASPTAIFNAVNTPPDVSVGNMVVVGEDKLHFGYDVNLYTCTDLVCSMPPSVVYSGPLVNGVLGQSSTFAYDAATDDFFAIGDLGNGKETLGRIHRTNGMGEVLVNDAGDVGGIAVDATFLYYTDADSIKRVTLASPHVATTLLSGAGSLGALALDAQFVYFQVADDGSVKKIRKPAD